jgi:predicted DNA-binding transcriptional regulator AlpA
MEARNRILEKSNELFNRHGIRRVTMDDIANQCGMSKKTIYQYFKDKDELVDAFAADRLVDNRNVCECDKSRAENAVHELFLAMDMVKVMFEGLHAGLLYDLEKYYPDTFSKFKKYKEEFLYGVIKENLEWGVKDGLYRDDIDIKIMTRFRLESMLLPFNLDIFPESKYAITNIEQEIMEHYVYGLATEKGRELISNYKTERFLNKKANV